MSRILLTIIFVFLFTTAFTGNPTAPIVERVGSADTPCEPDGPTDLQVGQEGSFSTGCSDCVRVEGGGFLSCDEEIPYEAKYQFDWGGGDLSGWGDNEETHSWSTSGNKYVKARSRCEDGESGWSNSHVVSIQPTCTISVTSPGSGTSWQEESSHAIQWDRSNCGSSVKIELYKGSSLRCTIDSSDPNDESYTWTVDDCGGGQGSDYRVKVTDITSGVSDYSGYFTITVPVQVYIEIEFWSDGIIVTTNNPSWYSGVSLRFDDLEGGDDPSNPAWDTCVGYGVVMDPSGLGDSDSWVFPTECTVCDQGLTIPSSATRATVEIRGCSRNEDPYCSVDATIDSGGGCSSTLAGGDIWGISTSCLGYSETLTCDPTGNRTEFKIIFDDSIYSDIFFLKYLKITFDDWNTSSKSVFSYHSRLIQAAPDE